MLYSAVLEMKLYLSFYLTC